MRFLEHEIWDLFNYHLILDHCVELDVHHSGSCSSIVSANRDLFCKTFCLCLLWSSKKGSCWIARTEPQKQVNEWVGQYKDFIYNELPLTNKGWDLEAFLTGVFLAFGFFHPKVFSFFPLYSPKSRPKWLLFPTCFANLLPFSFWLFNLWIIFIVQHMQTSILFILIHILIFYCNLLLPYLYPNAFCFICFWGHLQTILLKKYECVFLYLALIG